MSKLRHIYLRTSGGMGIPIEGAIDVDALPAELARQVRKTLSSHQLARAAQRSPSPFIADQIAYEIIVPDEQRGEPVAYTIHESQADDALLEVLDELTVRIIQEKMRARRARSKENAEENADGAEAGEGRGAGTTDKGHK